MKKLLVLALVLGLATAASAVTMDIYVNGAAYDGSSDVAINDVITIAINDPTPNPPLASMPSGGFAEFKIDVTAGSYNADAAFVSGVWAMGGIGSTAADGGFDVVVNGQLNPYAPQSAGDLITLTFDITADTTIDVIYGSYQNALGTTYHDAAAFDAVTLTVPEPMTVALLGLGGLFLRRRK